MSTIGATDPVQELNITVSSVRRRFNGKWLAFFLPKGTGVGGEGGKRETYTHRHTHASHSEGRGREQARQRGSEWREREREIPKAALCL